MEIMICHTSMQPIYEQIVEQIKTQVLHGTLKGGEALPSVRSLAGELKISALTVKKAYDCLEQEGMIVTVHGKGSFIAEGNLALLEETWKKEVENALSMAVEKGRDYGMTDEELRELFEIIMEEP